MSVYCERCTIRIEEGEVRYLITVHATADFDGTLPSAGSLEDLEAVMRIIDAKAKSGADHDVYQSKGFILCPPCKNLFMKNPMNLPPVTVGAEEPREGRVH